MGWIASKFSNKRSLNATKISAHSNIVVAPNPLNSPGLAPCNFALSSKLKMKVEGLMICNCMSHSMRMAVGGDFKSVVWEGVSLSGKKRWNQCNDHKLLK